MNIFKKLIFLLVILALLCSSVPAVQAQEEPNADQADKKVFLPLITTQSSSSQSALDTEIATESAADEGTIDAAQVKLVTRKVISPAKQKAALAFWTRQAIAAAPPLDVLVQVGVAAVDTAALSGPAEIGPSGFVAAGAAAPDADQVAKADFPLDWAALEELAAAEATLAEPTGTSQVYSSYIVNQIAALQKVYPHRWIGRLSFSVPGGTSYCSGTSISGNIMLTAAHCVYDTTNNVFYNNWAFTPAYRNGNAPYGTFPATTCWVLNSWIARVPPYNINTWAPHDVAVCNMGPNQFGTTLNNAVGWMGREWNASYIRHVHNLGYPFRDYNNALLANAGQYLRTCVAESFQQAAEVRGMGCNHGGGISGGPWVVGYVLSVVSGRATTVNSGIFIGTENIYGGRFNSNNIVPLCSAAGC